jgi:hypothetical protein
LDFGLWTLDFGLWTLDFGLWTLDFGLWTLDFGLWTLDNRGHANGSAPATIMKPLDYENKLCAAARAHTFKESNQIPSTTTGKVNKAR